MNKILVLASVIAVLLGMSINNAYAATSVAPTITVETANVTVTAPAKATFKVTATGTPAPKYQWMESADGVTFTDITGATSASYTTAATTIADSGTQYECVISNATGSVTSNVATLTVNVVPSITNQPSSLTVISPSTATFTVTASGTPTPSYQWMQKVSGGAYTDIPGAINATYTTPATTVDNSGTKYECVVSNVAGSVASNEATLTVDLVPSITAQPVDTTVTAPAKATFTVTASGTPNPTYQWMESVNGGVFTPIAGETKASYKTAATTTDDNGIQFECVISNTTGSVTSNAATLTVNVVPSITTQPTNLTVIAPASATFTVLASGTPAPTYQWMKEVKGGTYTNIPGATDASYTIAATAESDNKTKYKCVVSNAAGSVTSSAAKLMVDVVPSITTQPVDATVTAPAKATFKVAVTGTPKPTYQWMQSTDGVTFTNITGATKASYTTVATIEADSGNQYECVVTNAAGSMTSSAATLTVNSSVVAPSITMQPSNVAITAPAQATFTVAAIGTPAPTYQWMQEAAGASTYTAITGATSASYTTAATAATDNGTQYECVVTNAAGSATSNAATLSVNVVPSITTQPTSLTVTSPATATFTVAASGTPAPSYQWMQSVDGVTFTNIAGATSASYTTAATAATDNGTQYECVVTNAAGSVTSNAATLTVNVVPSITAQPANSTVISPATATFAVAASGTPAPSYQWMQSTDGVTFTNITGATSASYATPATTASNNGMQYECVVTNAAGSVTSNAATLTVNVVPSITTQPVSATVISPATATFTVSATGTPTPTYQWMQSVNGGAFTNISGATTASYTTLATTTANSGTQYECVVSNAAGNATSNAATLTVNVAPSITTQPANATVTSPVTATFTVAASGTPAPSYQWMQSTDGVTFTNITGATSASYTTPATTAANNGTQYECLVTNAAGNATSNAATLTVNVAPSITTQPANATVTSPVTATFTVAASGTPAPSYQWMQSTDGVTFTNITGATSVSYTTPATTAANSGTQYECVVTNAAGSATSNAATLTVNVIPSITTQPVNAIVTAPAIATFTVTATGIPTSTYQWQQEASGAGSYTTISGATSASYTTPATTTANSGTRYECVVTNSAGSVTSTAATLTVNPTPVAPSITTQPVSVRVTAPATATFTVAASGTPAPTYQWQQEASGAGSYTTISGATSASYTTPATTTANSGTQYECVISNMAGSVTSNAATLTVSGLPVITMTSPVNGSYSSSPVNFTVNTGEINGTIVRVNYFLYEGGNSYGLLGISTTPPFTAKISLSLGSYILVADAVDSYGQTSTMTPRTSITVIAPPTVAIVSPVKQSILTTGSVKITAIASESQGSISNVVFYNGTTLLGTVTSNTQAFTYTWPNIPSGTYNITAVATDLGGNTVTSAPVGFTINSVPMTYAIDNILLSKTDALNHTTTYQYDNDNRLLKTTFADGSTVAEAYDLFGNQISVTDQGGNILTKTYDTYERLSQTKDPLGNVTQFSYDTNGDLLTLTDANGNPTTYTYDGDYRVLTQTNALNFTTTFSYDPDGNLASRTDANGKVTNYTYDALNRLTNTAYPDSTSVTNVFDAIGEKTSMSDPSGSTTYTYDALSQLLTKTSPGTSNKITYTYDSEGNRLTSVDQNNRTITNAYDALNRLATVTDPVGKTTYGYDAVSNKASVATPNGVTATYTYDSLNRVLTDVNAKGSTVITSFSNVYDIAGMITKKTLQDGSWTAYTYDALNRLLEEAKQTSSAITYDYVYTYDPVGNRLTWNYNGTLRSYNFDAANRLSNWSYTINGSTQTDTYTYDNNGNRLSKIVSITGQANQQTTYGYDFENRLNQLNYVNIPNITGTQTDSLIYNGEGLRTQTVLNSVAANYLYDGSNILVERNGSNTTTKSYTRGLDFGGGIGSLIAQNTATGSTTEQYYQYNDLGSTANLTTNTGTATASYSYDAFGNLLTPQAGGDTNRYLFSTKEFDSRSGLEYFGGRYYDPEIGRWLTPDPTGISDGLNMYLYAHNNPVNLVDPNGKDALPLLAIGLASIGGAINGGVEAYTESVKGGSLGQIAGAFGQGFVSGFVGTGVGLAVLADTKNLSLAGAAASSSTNLTNQLISNGFDIDSINSYSVAQSAALGAVLAPIIQTIPGLQTVGQVPNAFLSRSLSQFGPNSLRLLGQEATGDVLSSVLGLSSGNDSVSNDSACPERE